MICTLPTPRASLAGYCAGVQIAGRVWVRDAVAGVLVIPFAAWALIRLTGPGRPWLLVTAMAFTPYAAALALVPVAAALVLRRWVVAAVAVVVAATLACFVLPRALGGPDRPSTVRFDAGRQDRGGGPMLRVLTTNMYVGGADPAALVALVRGHSVDLLALQEYTPEAAERLRVAGLDAVLPYRAGYPVDGVGGSALYSRYPLSATGYRRQPPYFGQAYATLTEPGAAPVLVESAHPCAPSDPSNLEYWRYGLGAEPRATPHGPVRLLLGDFNATLDHAPLRDLIGSGYRDTASVVGAGLVPTWPYEDSRLPGVTIDHVLADPRIAVRSVAVYPVPRSDHRAVFAELVLPPPAR